MIREHVDAVLAQLREDSILSTITFEGVVTDRPQRYCTLYADNGLRSVERLAGPSATASFTFTVHSVGSDPRQAQGVAGRVFAQLLDFTPTIPGRVCGRVQHSATQPVQRDTDVLPPLYFCVDVFTLTTDPA